MICGRKVTTPWRGTPRQISMPRMSQLVGCAKILRALRRLKELLTSAEESVCMRSRARCFCDGERKGASAAERGRYQRAKMAKQKVQRPSMTKR